MDYNKAIGERIRVARVVKNVTQKKLADFLGVTFQQSRKYELGLSKISAYRLFLVSKCLKVPMDFFFQPLDEEFQSSQDSKISNELQEPLSSSRNNLEFMETVPLFELSNKENKMDDFWHKYSSMDSQAKGVVLDLMRQLSK